MSIKRTEAMSKAVAAVVAGAKMCDAAEAHGVTTRGLRLAMQKDGLPTPARGRPRGRKPKAERTDLMRRQNRLAQAALRGSKHSFKTEAENLGLLLLWEAEVLSEGQLSKALDLDRVTLRQMRLDAIDAATKFAEAMLKPKKAQPNEWQRRLLVRAEIEGRDHHD